MPGAALPLTAGPMTGRTLGKYEVVCRLSTGGMSAIYLAFQKGLAGFRKLVVLKSILPDIAGEEEFVRMFLDEAKITAAFTHPNIATVFDLDVQDGELFLAMEFVQGCTLVELARACRQNNEPIPQGLSLSAVRDTALALHYAHTFVSPTGRKQVVIHRDVAEKNIMVTYEGVTKLLDFGIAKALNREGRTTIGMVKGTSGYMSPEQIMGEKLDPRSDIFSLGVVLHELLTGMRLFHGKTPEDAMMAALKETVTPPSRQNSEVSPAIDAVVMKALARNREDRYATALELARALERSAAGRLWHPEECGVVVQRLFTERREQTRGLYEQLSGGNEVTGEQQIRSLLATLGNPPTPPPRPGAPKVEAFATPPPKPEPARNSHNASVSSPVAPLPRVTPQHVARSASQEESKSTVITNSEEVSDLTQIPTPAKPRPSAKAEFDKTHEVVLPWRVQPESDLEQTAADRTKLPPGFDPKEIVDEPDREQRTVPARNLTPIRKRPPDSDESTPQFISTGQRDAHSGSTPPPPEASDAFARAGDLEEDDSDEVRTVIGIGGDLGRHVDSDDDERPSDLVPTMPPGEAVGTRPGDALPKDTYFDEDAAPPRSRFKPGYLLVVALLALAAAAAWFYVSRVRGDAESVPPPVKVSAKPKPEIEAPVPTSRPEPEVATAEPATVKPTEKPPVEKAAEKPPAPAPPAEKVAKPEPEAKDAQREVKPTKPKPARVVHAPKRGPRAGKADDDGDAAAAVDPKKSGQLTLVVEPWVKVSLNGRALGNTPLVKLSVPAGRHVFRLDAEDGKHYSLPIDIKEGGEVKRKLSLSDLQPD